MLTEDQTPIISLPLRTISPLHANLASRDWKNTHTCRIFYLQLSALLFIDVTRRHMKRSRCDRLTTNQFHSFNLLRSRSSRLNVSLEQGTPLWSQGLRQWQSWHLFESAQLALGDNVTDVHGNITIRYYEIKKIVNERCITSRTSVAHVIATFDVTRAPSYNVSDVINICCLGNRQHSHNVNATINIAVTATTTATINGTSLCKYCYAYRFS